MLFSPYLTLPPLPPFFKHQSSPIIDTGVGFTTGGINKKNSANYMKSTKNTATAADSAATTTSGGNATKGKPSKKQPGKVHLPQTKTVISSVISSVEPRAPCPLQFHCGGKCHTLLIARKKRKCIKKSTPVNGAVASNQGIGSKVAHSSHHLIKKHTAANVRIKRHSIRKKTPENEHNKCTWLTVFNYCLILY